MMESNLKEKVRKYNCSVFIEIPLELQLDHILKLSRPNPKHLINEEYVWIDSEELGIKEF